MSEGAFGALAFGIDFGDCHRVAAFRVTHGQVHSGHWHEGVARHGVIAASSRRGFAKAAVATARKMAILMLTLWKTETDFKWTTRAARLSWPLPPDLFETDIERLLFPRTAQEAARKAVEPGWVHIHRELRIFICALSLHQVRFFLTFYFRPVM